MKASRINVSLKVKLKERLKVFTSSSHNETGISQSPQQTGRYFDPFIASLAQHFKTGILIDDAVVNGVLSSTKTGSEMSKKLVQRKLIEVDGRASIFERKITCNYERSASFWCSD